MNYCDFNKSVSFQRLFWFHLSTKCPIPKWSLHSNCAPFNLIATYSPHLLKTPCSSPTCRCHRSFPYQPRNQLGQHIQRSSPPPESDWRARAPFWVMNIKQPHPKPSSSLATFPPKRLSVPASLLIALLSKQAPAGFILLRGSNPRRSDPRRTTYYNRPD